MTRPPCLSTACAHDCTTECRDAVNAAWQRLRPTEPAPASLRDQYAQALYDTYGQQDRDRSLRIADAVLAVRDAEMQQLRARVAELEQQAAIDRVCAVAPMLDALDTLIATSSRDWGQYRVDAWLWAVLCGWDCEDDHVHDDLCDDGAAMAEMQERHGWSDETVAKARRYRAAVREVVAALDGPARPGPQP